MIEAFAQQTGKQTGKPRLGFLGVGWIGRNRLEALKNAGFCKLSAITEPNSEMAAKARQIAPECELINSFEELLESKIDALVIATPSALHADQAIAALNRGISVFCQKPLGRNAPETQRVVRAARKNDCLLAVDYAYRFIDGAEKMRELIHAGEIGSIFAADLVFHNAYGPDKSWFFERPLSGGGCLIDLGTHLVDLAWWMLDSPRVSNVTGRLFARGNLLKNLDEAVEDYASARIDLTHGATINLACSWHLHAGCEAEISATFYGTKGGLTLKNQNGSFFDFETSKFEGTKRKNLTADNENNQNWNWGGRAVLNWAEKLSKGEKYDRECENLVETAEILDAVYAQSGMRRNNIF